GQRFIDRLEEIDEAAVALGQLAEIPSHFDELDRRGGAHDPALNDDEPAARSELRQPGANDLLAMGGMDEDAARELSEAEPRQLVAQALALLLDRGRHDHERPLATP